MRQQQPSTQRRTGSSRTPFAVSLVPAPRSSLHIVSTLWWAAAGSWSSTTARCVKMHHDWLHDVCWLKLIHKLKHPLLLWFKLVAWSWLIQNSLWIENIKSTQRITSSPFSLFWRISQDIMEEWEFTWRIFSQSSCSFAYRAKSYLLQCKELFIYVVKYPSVVVQLQMVSSKWEHSNLAICLHPKIIVQMTVTYSVCRKTQAAMQCYRL